MKRLNYLLIGLFFSLFTFAVSVADIPEHPNAPRNVTATTLSTTEINLGWEYTMQDFTARAGTPGGFFVYRDTTCVARIDTTARNYHDRGLLPGTKYTYRIVAYCRLGGTASSDTVSATTGNVLTDTTTPEAPSNVRVTVTGATTATVTWDGPRNSGFFIGVSYVDGWTFPVGATSGEITGLKGGITYYATIYSFVTVDGKNYYSSPTNFSITTVTDVPRETSGVPKNFGLSQNFPNPFNPTTAIDYSIPKTSKVSLKVYNILGKEVTTLVNGEKPAGSYSVDFNANNLPSGVYFYRIQAGNFTETKKMVLMK